MTLVRTCWCGNALTRKQTRGCSRQHANMGNHNTPKQIAAARRATAALRQKYHTRVVRAVIADLRPFVAREHIKAVALIIAKHRAESYKRGHAVAYHQLRRAS